MIKYTKKEEIWNAASHGGGIALGVVIGIIFLVWCFHSENNWARIGVILYLFGMLGSYLASTLYHSIKHHSKWKERLRKWDHAAIYWHIAGSYSPLTLTALRDLESLLLRMDLCPCRNHHQFHQTKGTFERGDLLFCGHGFECAGSLQTIARHRICCCRCLADCRGC